MVDKTVGTFAQSREWHQKVLSVTVFSIGISLENVLDEGVKMIDFIKSQPLSAYLTEELRDTHETSHCVLKRSKEKAFV